MGEWFFLRLAGMSPERPIGIYENREEDLNTHSGKHNLLLPFSKKKNRLRKNCADLVAKNLFNNKNTILSRTIVLPDLPLYNTHAKKY